MTNDGLICTFRYKMGKTSEALCSSDLVEVINGIFSACLILCGLGIFSKVQVRVVIH